MTQEPNGLTGLSHSIFPDSGTEDQPECTDLLELGRFNSVDFDRKTDYLSEEFCELVSTLFRKKAVQKF